MATRTFIDAGVLITAFQGRGPDALKALAVLDDPDREFVASSLLKLELLPQPTFHRRSAELEFFGAFFDAVHQWQTVNEALVTLALREASRLTLDAVDALHVAAAQSQAVAEFITTEKLGKPIHKVTAFKVIALSALPPPG